MIQHNKPTLGNEEENCISEIIKSGWIAQGLKVKQFENDFSQYINKKAYSSCAVSSGTAALYLALKALNIQPKDKIILPTYTCSAVLNAVFMIGAEPLLCDIEEITWNIDFNQILSKMKYNPKAAIIPHTFGFPCDFGNIKREINIPVIEDCAVAIGSTFIDPNNKIGLIGDISIFSFYATKIITTGQGGMVLSDNSEYVNYVRDYMNFDCVEEYKPRFNFQMTDIQAGLGIEQLKKLSVFLSKRKEISNEYIKVCNKKGFNYQSVQGSNWYRFILKLDNLNTVLKLKEYLGKNGISVIIPIEQYELLHRYLKLSPKDYEKGEHLAVTTLSLPIYPSLTENELDHVIKILESF